MADDPDRAPICPNPICPLCDRPIPAGVPQSRHHLIPRLKGGKNGPVVLLHAVCHLTIHKTLTEAQLARDYATMPALRAHPEIARFVTWVARRPPGWRGRVR
ncbi:HNH endonuclease [Paracoccus sp. p4-l81]|uniref:HNH endonuclease n=1 Tax=unclassified Paracoccus (in: a-proteobacteria) TaxID=2688777 RepID=UPI0035BB6F10